MEFHFEPGYQPHNISPLKPPNSKTRPHYKYTSFSLLPLKSRILNPHQPLNPVHQHPGGQNYYTTNTSVTKHKNIWWHQQKQKFNTKKRKGKKKKKQQKILPTKILTTKQYLNANLVAPVYDGYHLGNETRNNTCQEATLG